MKNIRLTSDQVRLVRKAMGNLQSTILAQNSNFYSIGIVRELNEEDLRNIDIIMKALKEAPEE